MNNNYLLKKVKEIRGASVPYAEGQRRIEQVRYSWETMTQETGVTTDDVTCRMADFGMHMWSSHHPFIVPQPFTLEPTESYAKAELDEYVAALRHVSDEAYTSPETVKTAPHQSVTRGPGTAISTTRTSGPSRGERLGRSVRRNLRRRIV